MLTSEKKQAKQIWERIKGGEENKIKGGDHWSVFLPSVCLLQVLNVINILRTQIQKVQKDTYNLTEFLHFCDLHV